MHEVKFTFLDKNLSDQDKSLLVPKRKSEWASGFDLASASHEEIIIKPQECMLVPTGIAIMLLPGFEAQIRSRSGLSLNHNIVVLNSPGTIDADYRGEIKIITMNFGKENFRVTFGMRIAQMVIAQVCNFQAVEILELDESKRGISGFGSTGLH
jgi:dUTP pyrophosphatase